MATASDLGWTESELYTNQRVNKQLVLCMFIRYYEHFLTAFQAKRVDFVKDNTGNLWVVKQLPDVDRARKEFV
jgi:hypothetical protein